MALPGYTSGAPADARAARRFTQKPIPDLIEHSAGRNLASQMLSWERDERKTGRQRVEFNLGLKVQCSCTK